MTKRTVDEINDDHSISKRFKETLNDVPTQDLRPYRLMQWSKEVFKISREEGFNDSVIAELVECYGRARYYSPTQIRSVISCNINGCDCTK